ncbi:GTP-binding protein HflX [Peptoanaerobacter stomatis]|uniref:GTPase HflX n=1 Tax=Peptoanaerobacter stomatis TaxID=796937 RepID=J6HFA5_9FIRM|nr:GTPase HflX [Peptoanaerobacter stomatis]EJU21433.1 GTP-binding protein HflX [Peptoanaerobacter stomatis]NWO24691.1 GTPase HflX [Peptostreptococcaceae bacterium oral taxon 081]
MSDTKNIEKVILVGLNITTNIKKQTDIDIYDSMKELEELAQAAGTKILGTTVQNKETYDAAYYIGKGKAEELAELAENMEADTIIFNEELSGVQIKNLEEITKAKVIDRTTLILDIFASRALSKEGKLQVELAQQKYRSARLIGLGSQLSRLGGGIGTRGPGEKKLEIDKRHIKQRIIDIQKELKEISKNRQTQRSSRAKSNLPLVALVGYTNSGKSTILNEIIKTHKDYDKEKEVYVQDMLFATLDVQLRKATLPSNSDYLITDTVGFVSQIPHDLIEAFKATLEEVKYADLLLHVVDLSNDKYKLQMDTTNKVLSEIGVDNKKVLYVFNKADKVNYEANISVNEPFIMISATKRYNIDKFYEMIEQMLSKSKKKVELLIPYSNSDIINKLHDKYNFEEIYEENGTRLKVSLEEEEYGRYKNFITQEF